MKRITTLFVVSICLILPAGQAWAGEFTFDDAKEMAINAAALIEKESIDRAREIFHDPCGGFIKGERGELYVFVVNFDGILLVHPRPDIEGRYALDWKDDHGNFYIKDMISIARKKGQGWVKYLCWDPKSGRVIPKVSFVTRVGNKEMLAGAGIFVEEGTSFSMYWWGDYLYF